MIIPLGGGTRTAGIPVTALNLLKYGADPTGAAFSDTAMVAALADLGSGPGVITTGPGTYKFAGSYQFGPGQGITTGLPNLAVIFNYTGNGVFITSRDPSFNIGTTSPLVSICGPQTGYTIDGTSAGSAAKAFQLGDQNSPDVNIGIRNFAGATAMGAWLNSVIGWVNFGRIAINTDNCTNHVVFDNTSGINIMGVVIYDFGQLLRPNQIGVSWLNGARALGGEFRLASAANGAVSSNSGSVLFFDNSGSNSGLQNCHLMMNLECDSGGTGATVGPITINRSSAGLFSQNHGIIHINNSSGNFQPSVGLGGGSANYSFTGTVVCNVPGDAMGTVPFGFGSSEQGGSLWSGGFAGGGTIYNTEGDYFLTTLANGANTYALQTLVAHKAQRILWVVTQPASGAAATLTITGAKTTAGGGAVTLSATNNASDIVEIATPDGVNWYAQVLGLNYH